MPNQLNDQGHEAHEADQADDHAAASYQEIRAHLDWLCLLAWQRADRLAVEADEARRHAASLRYQSYGSWQVIGETEADEAARLAALARQADQAEREARHLARQAERATLAALDAEDLACGR